MDGSVSPVILQDPSSAPQTEIVPGDRGPTLVRYAEIVLDHRPTPPAPPPRGSWVGKLVRRSVALLLIGVTLVWLVLPMVCPVTSQAVVNAVIVQVRAPIDGTTQDLSAELGESVYAGSPLVSLTNKQVDSIHLPGLQVKQTEFKAKRARLVKEIAETEAAERACRAEADKYRAGRVSVLLATQREHAAQIEVATASLQLRKKGLERVQGGKSSVPLQDVDSATESEFAARKRIEMSRASLERVEEELKGAREGIYLHQEAPACLERAEELATKLPQLRSSLIEAEEMLAGVEKEIEREQARVARLTEAKVASPVSGLVWTRRGNPGQVVKQNETLFEVAEAKTVFVEALLSQRHLCSVRPGGRATIVLTGGQTFTGRVRSVRTPGPEEAESAYAVKLGKQDLKQVRVLIDFDGGPGDVSLVGRHARVLISDEEPGPVQRSLVWLFSALGG